MAEMDGRHQSQLIEAIRYIETLLYASCWYRNKEGHLTILQSSFFLWTIGTVITFFVLRYLSALYNATPTAKCSEIF